MNQSKQYFFANKASLFASHHTTSWIFKIKIRNYWIYLWSIENGYCLDSGQNFVRSV